MKGTMMSKVLIRKERRSGMATVFRFASRKEDRCTIDLLYYQNHTISGPSIAATEQAGLKERQE